jgi:hypothetical protein
MDTQLDVIENCIESGQRALTRFGQHGNHAVKTGYIDLPDQQVGPQLVEHIEEGCPAARSLASPGQWTIDGLQGKDSIDPRRSLHRHGARNTRRRVSASGHEFGP